MQQTYTAYNPYPTFPLPDGQIHTGYASLAQVIAAAITGDVCEIVIDGYGGVLWEDFRAHLDGELQALGVEVEWRDVAHCRLPEAEIDALIAPYLGGDDPLFGKLCDLELSALFDAEALAQLSARTVHPCIIYGTGAALINAWDTLLYVDVPKDEIQRRMTQQTITNLGASHPSDKSTMYKRFFFVDWQVLNRHKAWLLPHIKYFIDLQDTATPIWVAGQDLRDGLTQMSVSSFRAKPWFAPGAWGGQWMKEHFGLDPAVKNYAWSFELIAPENGLLFESDGVVLECSFDLLMYQHYEQVLGRAAERFGCYFPIRFDYLDTFAGGNLSIQCHPRPEYIRTHFGEPFTQDESYYITACEPGARVYLGFQEGITREAFYEAVTTSQQTARSINADEYIFSAEAHPHDLFLIPCGTVHGAGVNNLVLEISATPYIYTFKIYDWVRLDLDGKPRALNIERAFDNLYLERQADYVRQHLIPRPSLVRAGDGWREVLVGTHDLLFYEVRRYELEPNAALTVETAARCHILNVVEGDSVIIETANGHEARYHFAETFIIPAAAAQYRLKAFGARPCKVVCAFVK